MNPDKHRKHYIPELIVRFYNNDATYCSGRCEHQRPPDIAFRYHCSLYNASLENSGPYGMWSIPCDACNAALEEHLPYQELLKP
jgi:hypothetical protein